MASQAVPGEMTLRGPQTINTAARETSASTNVTLVDGGDNLVAVARTDWTGLGIIDIARGPGYRPGIFQV
jgi:hypothetical protein